MTAVISATKRRLCYPADGPTQRCGWQENSKREPDPHKGLFLLGETGDLT